MVKIAESTVSPAGPKGAQAQRTTIPKSVKLALDLKLRDTLEWHWEHERIFIEKKVLV